MFRSSPCHAFAAVCVLLTFSGCGKSTVPMVEVTGIVMLDGKPLADAKVNFVATPGKEKASVQDSIAVTDQNGAFTLQGVHGDKGAMPGKHKVIISKLVSKDGKPLPVESDPALLLGKSKELLPKKYSHVMDSELTADVPEKGGLVTFDLKTKS